MKLIEKARKFLESKSARFQAFADREHELKTKITELEAKKSAIINDYDPSKPFDAKAIDKLDTEIEAAHKEIAVLRVSKQSTPQYVTTESAQHIEAVREEATKLLAQKAEQEEKARDKILKAKNALLAAQAEHHNLMRDINYLRDDTNETMRELSVGIRREIDNLRRQAQELDREAYILTPDSTYFVANGQQAELDAVLAKRDKLRKEISRLEGLTAEVGVGIAHIDSYRDRNGKTIYYVHSPEQLDAYQKGIKGDS